MKIFRIKAIAYLVVGIFILTHMCSLYTAIADCDIEDINAAEVKLKNLLDELDDAKDDRDDEAQAYDDYVDSIGLQYAFGIGAPFAFGLFGGLTTAAGAALLGAAITTIKVSTAIFLCPRMLSFDRVYLHGHLLLHWGCPMLGVVTHGARQQNTRVLTK